MAEIQEAQETVENLMVSVEGMKDIKSSKRRSSVHAISNFDAVVHLLKGNIGIGILTLPLALRNAGLVFGGVCLILVMVLCVHCMAVLARAAQKCCRNLDDSKLALDYASTAESAFRSAGGAFARHSSAFGKIINVFLALSQVGSNAVYVLFMAQNVQPLFQQYGGRTFATLSYRFYVAMLLPPTILVCSIRNLRYLSPVSVMGNVIHLTGLLIVFYYIFRDPLPPVTSVPWMADVDRLPLFFGTAIYVMEGISVVLPVENAMRRPESLLGWTGVLSRSMTFIGALYSAMAFFGYLRFGEDTASSITLNLPPEDAAAQITLLLFCFSIFFSYAIQFYVLMDVVGPNVIKTRVSQKWYSAVEHVARVVIHLFTLPWLDLVVSLLGAVKMSTLCLMAPALIDVASNWNDNDRSACRILCLAKNAFVFAFGLVGCSFGTYTSLVNIVENFANDTSHQHSQ